MIDAPTTPGPAEPPAIPVSPAEPSAPNEFRALVALTVFPFVAMMRNIATFAFGFLFPVVFISVFGLIGSGGSGPRLGIPSDVARGPAYDALENYPTITLIPGDRADLERQLRLGKLDGVVDISGGRVSLQVNSVSPSSRASRLFVESVLNRLNVAATGVTTPPYQLEVAEIAGRTDRYIDFALPGLIGFSVLSTSIFGTVFGLLFLKQALILKRLLATPVHGITILLGQGLARLAMTLLQTTVILALGILAFGFQLANGVTTFVGMLGLSALGLIVFLGFGVLIAGQARDENSASPLTNIITLPQFLLSGVFFPTDVFPSWVRIAADLLPLTSFNNAMRQIATEGAGPEGLVVPILALCVWGVLAYAIAARTFKWTVT